MPTVRNWRSPRTADDFATLDYADFAQEFLRRNPDYCRQYHAVMAPGGAVDQDQALANLARHWGLSFPLHPRPPGRPSPRPLGAGTVGGHGRSGRRVH